MIKLKLIFEWIIAGFIGYSILKITYLDIRREWKAKWLICPHCKQSYKVYQNDKV